MLKVMASPDVREENASHFTEGGGAEGRCPFDKEVYHVLQLSHYKVVLPETGKWQI